MLLMYADGSWYDSSKKIGVGVLATKALACERNSFAPIIQEFLFFSKDVDFHRLTHKPQAGLNEFFACLNALHIAQELQNTYPDEKNILIINDSIEMVKAFNKMKFPLSIEQKVAHLIEKIDYDKNRIKFHQLPRYTYGMKLADMLSKINKNHHDYYIDKNKISDFNHYLSKLIDTRYDVCANTEILFKQKNNLNRQWFSHLTNHLTLTDYLLSL